VCVLVNTGPGCCVCACEHWTWLLCVCLRAQIEVETVDKTGTFIGSLWVKRSNAGVLLLEAGLARLHPSFFPDRTAEGPALQAAEKRARDARLGVRCFLTTRAEEPWPASSTKCLQLSQYRTIHAELQSMHSLCDHGCSQYVLSMRGGAWF